MRSSSGPHREFPYRVAVGIMRCLKSYWELSSKSLVWDSLIVIIEIWKGLRREEFWSGSGNGRKDTIYINVRGNGKF